VPGHLLALLRVEERQLLAELRASATFQKLEAVRRVIALYANVGGVGGHAEDGQAAVDLLLGNGAADPQPTARDAPAPAVAPATATPAAPPTAAAVPSAAFFAAATARAEPQPAPPPRAEAEPPPREAVAALQAAAAAAANADGLGLPPEAPRDGSKTVSAVRAALLAAVTR
jgi:hypothetical protein